MTKLVPPIPDRAPATTAQAAIALMARNRITRMPADRSDVDGGLYSNLADAFTRVTRRADVGKDEA